MTNRRDYRLAPLLTLTLGLVAGSAAPAEDWVARSDSAAQIYLDMLAKYTRV